MVTPEADTRSSSTVYRFWQEGHVTFMARPGER
jgi:hypothetical protein